MVSVCTARSSLCHRYDTTYGHRGCHALAGAALAAFTSMSHKLPTLSSCNSLLLPSTASHDEYVRKRLLLQVMMNSNPMYSPQQQQMRGGSVTLSNSGGSISRGQQSARGQYCINPGQVIHVSGR